MWIPHDVATACRGQCASVPQTLYVGKPAGTCDVAAGLSGRKSGDYVADLGRGAGSCIDAVMRSSIHMAHLHSHTLASSVGAVAVVSQQCMHHHIHYPHVIIWLVGQLTPQVLLHNSCCQGISRSQQLISNLQQQQRHVRLQAYRPDPSYFGVHGGQPGLIADAHLSLQKTDFLLREGWCTCR